MFQNVYVSLRDKDCIARFKLDGSGVITPLAPVDAPGGPAPMATDSSGQHLYLGQRFSRHLSSFHIEPNGDLTLIGRIDVKSDPNCLFMDRTGRYLLSSYYRGEGLHVHAVAEDGALREEAVAWQDTALSTHSFQTDPTNRFAYGLHIAAGIGPNAIYQYSFDCVSGRIAPMDPPCIVARGQAGPRHCCFHPTLPLLYACNEQGSSITSYHIDTTSGRLTEKESVSLIPAGYDGATGCTQIRITRNARWIFAPLGGHCSLVSLRVAADGALSVADHAPMDPGPRAIGLDADDRFVLAPDTRTGYLNVYSIDHDTGKLGLRDRSPLDKNPSKATPMWVLATKP